MKISEFIFYISPFIVFFLTHIFVSEYYFVKNKVIVPNFCNKSLKDVVIWSNKNKIAINIYKISNEKTIEDLKILNQFPKNDCKININSQINLEINLINKLNEKDININNISIDKAEKILLKEGFSFEIKEILCEEEENIVIGSLKKDNKHYILYVTKKENKNFIINNYINQNCLIIKNLLKEKNINTRCFDSNNLEIKSNHDQVIKEQNPIPGSFINNFEKKIEIFFWH